MTLKQNSRSKQEDHTDKSVGIPKNYMKQIQDKKATVIYHADADGRMGAAVAKLFFKQSPNWLIDNVEFIETNHGKEFEFKKEYDTLVIIDFSFNSKTMKHLNYISNGFIWIDHHKSAKENNQKLWETSYGERDIEYSGASLTWKTFFKDQEIPKAVKLVEDYDLWRFKFGNETKYFGETDGDWTMDEFYDCLKNPLLVEDALIKGKLFYERKLKIIENKLKVENENIKWTIFKKYKTALINNTDGSIGSMLGNEICKREDFDFEIVLKYSIKKNRIIFGLNSVEDIDVSTIAKSYGGGGHKNAAGFNLDLERGFKLLKELYGVE